MMALAERPVPVKLFAAILWSDSALLKQALELMCGKWGDLDSLGIDHIFNATNYYNDEMGQLIHRRLIAFKELVQPDHLSEAKTICNQFEVQIMKNNQRKINI
ncbi:MAG: DUF4416 family protein, partial [Chlamydiota bacterium]|nr:DUF4416 family protein [Chlamydiota bacterium]